NTVRKIPVPRSLPPPPPARCQLGLPPALTAPNTSRFQLESRSRAMHWFPPLREAPKGKSRSCREFCVGSTIHSSSIFHRSFRVPWAGCRSVLIQIFSGNIIFRHFVGVNLCLVLHIFHAFHNFSLERISFFQQFVDAFRIGAPAIRKSL